MDNTTIAMEEEGIGNQSSAVEEEEICRGSNMGLRYTGCMVMVLFFTWRKLGDVQEICKGTFLQEFNNFTKKMLTMKSRDNKAEIIQWFILLKGNKVITLTIIYLFFC